MAPRTSIVLVFALLASTAVVFSAVDAQSPEKSPPAAHTPKASHSHTTKPPAAAPSPVEPPAGAIPPSSIGGSPADAPGPAVSGAVFSTGFGIAGSMAAVFFAAVLIA